jgi:hypothetical protein
VCAPALTTRSSHRPWLDTVIETWDAASPTLPGQPSGTSGRVLVFTAGGWREIDSFRCVGGELDRALRDADRQSLGEWQRGASVARRTAALAAADRGDSEAALGLLRDALAVDGCDVANWRLLGRIEVRGGGPAAAVPPLAVAVALRPHDPAALLDLADALDELARTSGDGGEAWPAARRVLASRKGTQPLVERSGSEHPGDLARVLYERFLALTERSAPRLGPQRRHARARLERSDTIVNPGAPAPSPTVAR